jgi:hypothetical protein
LYSFFNFLLQNYIGKIIMSAIARLPVGAKEIPVFGEKPTNSLINAASRVASAATSLGKLAYDETKKTFMDFFNGVSRDEHDAALRIAKYKHDKLTQEIEKRDEEIAALATPEWKKTALKIICVAGLAITAFIAFSAGKYSCKYKAFSCDEHYDK